MLGLRILISLSCHSILFLWIRLEINIVSVLPILSSIPNSSSSELALKYFISQSVASIIFLFAFLFSRSGGALGYELRALAILFKLGIPPFHRWLARIIFISPYKIIFILLVIQKFIPLHILRSIHTPNIFILVVARFSFFHSFLILKNISRVRATLLLSAWGNSIWLIVSTTGSKLWFPFLFWYGVFLGSTLFLVQLIGAQKFSSMVAASPVLKLFCLLNFLNLAGLPPFSGFFIKLVLLKRFFFYAPISLIIRLLNLSLVVLFAYLSITYYTLSSNFPGRLVKNYYSSFSTSLFSCAPLVFFPLVNILSL